MIYSRRILQIAAAVAGTTLFMSAKAIADSLYRAPVKLQAAINRLHVGDNLLEISITSANGLPVEGAHLLLKVNMTSMDMGETNSLAAEISPGRYGAHVQFTMDGNWSVTTVTSIPGLPQRSVNVFLFTVAPTQLAQGATNYEFSPEQRKRANSRLLGLWETADGRIDKERGMAATLQQVRKIYSLGADVNVRDPHGVTPLMLAANSGNLEIIKYLLSKGSDINARESSGWTALEWASNADQFQSLKYLAENGADINAANYVGGTALIYATEENDFAAVKLLLAAGANVNAKDSDGLTPLMDSAYLGSEQCVQLFLASGADVNAKDSHGWTALMQASSADKPACVKELLANGADKAITSTDGETALSAASKFPEIAELLQP